MRCAKLPQEIATRAICHATILTLVIFLALSLAFASADEPAPNGKLRAVYLAGNPSQAVQDKATGVIRGASADLARELGRRIGVPVEIGPVADPKAVIDAVSGGSADIGFVAFAPERVGTVEFSQVYMLVQQSYLVREDSTIRAIADLDRAGLKIAGTKNDSITLFMKRKFKEATVVETGREPAEIKRMLMAKEIDAFGANRQRLTNLMQDTPSLRILPERAADHHRGEGQAGSAHGRQSLYRRCARFGFSENGDRKKRRGRARPGARRLMDAESAGLKNSCPSA